MVDKKKAKDEPVPTTAGGPNTDKKATKRVAPPPKESPKVKIPHKMLVELPSPMKCPVDHNQYRAIKLPNGITALLVHQNEGTPHHPHWHHGGGTEFGHSNSGNLFMDSLNPVDHCGGFGDEGLNCLHSRTGVRRAAGFALCVNVGSSYDPEDVNGLAHFCEHMVFYGTEKYPEEDGYMHFVNTKGYGVTNAFTQPMTTCYHTVVREGALVTALDRFSNMMAAPIFVQDCVHREVFAVDNEFFLRKWMDGQAHVEILLGTADKAHPLNSFNCGNCKTLYVQNGIEKLRKDLVNFHQKYYVASAMTFVIQSSRGLDELQKLVVEHLGTIPEGSRGIRREMEVEEEHLEPFETEAFNKLYVIGGQESRQCLRITWSLPPEAWMVNNAQAVAFLEVLMGEVDGGLENKLRNMGLITSFDAGSPPYDLYRNEYTTLFEIEMCVVPSSDKKETLEGKALAILEPVFQYLGALRRFTPQQRRTLWNELSNTTRAYFDHSGPGSVANLTINSAIALQFLQPEDLFTSKYFDQGDYNDQTIVNLLALLTPQRMNVSISINETVLARNPVYKQDLASSSWEGDREKFSEHNFWCKHFSSATLQRLEKAMKTGTQGSAGIRQNDFAQLVTTTARQSMGKAEPRIIHWNEKCLIYHGGHVGDSVHKGQCVVRFFPSKIGTNPANLMKLEILKRWWHGKLTPALVQMQRSGMNVSIDGQQDMLALWLSGFPEEFPMALRALLPTLFAGDTCTEREFAEVKLALHDALYDALGSGRILVTSILMDLIHPSGQPLDACLPLLEGISYEEFRHFGTYYGKVAFSYVVVEGNVNLDVCDEIAVLLDDLRFFPSVPGWKNCLALASGRGKFPALPTLEKCARVMSRNGIEENSWVLNTYQVMENRAPFNPKMKIIMRLISHLMRSSVFPILRTTQQVGYVVSLQGEALNNQFLLIVLVAFPHFKLSLCHVDEKIDGFFGEFEKLYLRKLSQQDFDQMKEGLGIRDPLTLAEVRNWYNATFLQQIEETTPTRAIWKNNKQSPLRKISIQSHGTFDEFCCPKPRCKDSKWTRPTGTRPLMFAFDGKPSPNNYFIPDVLQFRENCNDR